MKRLLGALAALILISAAPPPEPQPHWSPAQVERLIRWMSAAADEALTPMAADVPALRAVLDGGDSAATDRAATDAAVRLLTALRQGCCNASLRTGWNIEETRSWPEPRAAIAQALSQDRLDALFAQARPAHPYYQALRAAYAKEPDMQRRATLAANLDRWRWMPRDLGARYLLVNAANYEATLWQDRRIVGRWSVVVGKTGTPTPVFQATVTGVTFNPWWEVPASIAKESVAGIVARRPAEAARRGYVLEGGRYRQRPGPSNALGQMKLVMPNRFSVYLHDTPSKSLFSQSVRAYSHGCIRVGDALGLATTLLNWTRAETDAFVASGKTETVPLSTPVPVYITYFTAEPNENGDVRYFKDIYHRDRGASAPGEDGSCL
ncbi:MAG: L,D-transpeptidase family protein [Sphingomonadales bacterium]|nr:L,D-transpeptidase family protein [Sphingomonadales bacterium]